MKNIKKYIPLIIVLVIAGLGFAYRENISRAVRGDAYVDNKIFTKQLEKAQKSGIKYVDIVIEMGNPKTLLATDIPEEHKVDLIMVGATGLNAFERLLVGSSSEYILRHAKVDLLVVRDPEKTL